MPGSESVSQMGRIYDRFGSIVDYDESGHSFAYPDTVKIRSVLDTSCPEMHTCLTTAPTQSFLDGIRRKRLHGHYGKFMGQILQKGRLKEEQIP